MVKELIGEGKTPAEILGLPISAKDRVWVLTRPKMISETSLREFVYRCAEKILAVYESRFPEDTRPREAIAAHQLGEDIAVYVAFLDCIHAVEWDEADIQIMREILDVDKGMKS